MGRGNTKGDEGRDRAFPWLTRSASAVELNYPVQQLDSTSTAQVFRGPGPFPFVRPLGVSPYIDSTSLAAKTFAAGCLVARTGNHEHYFSLYFSQVTLRINFDYSSLKVLLFPTKVCIPIRQNNPMAKRRKSGEDPKIRSMRVRVWVRAVRLASGLSLAELEEEFSQPWSGPKPSVRSCIWDKYYRGEVVPRTKLRSKEGPSLVERVEKEYPGTAKWLSSPLWRALDIAPIDMGEIRDLYEELPDLFRSIFIAPPHEESEIFWRRPVDLIDTYRILALLSEQDALHAFMTILIMIKEAETTQNQDQHALGVNRLQECKDKLRKEPVLQEGFLGEIYDYLDERWEEIHYFSVYTEDEDGDESDTDFKFQ